MNKLLFIPIFNTIKHLEKGGENGGVSSIKIWLPDGGQGQKAK